MSLTGPEMACFLPLLVEKANDAHQITIVSDGPQTVPQDYKFLVLDKGGLWNQPALQDETPFKDRAINFGRGHGIC